MQYLTAEGLEKIKEELAVLKKKIHEVTARIDQAKELGDLSENAEYHEAKEDYAFTQGRILELEDIINHVIMIEKTSGGQIALGSTIKISGSNGREVTYMIVGSNEADPAQSKISNESPLAQAFLGHKQGDKVEVKTPTGKVVYTIVEVK